ncbi:MAG: hypothetical protein ALECFALPRED_008662 [Alectoria fallacina]|uniref:BTB domain-containing protein n=1 Tax=Alectoria fallacina TaxID=1903189 RepID=A0A8H3J457_9LECA|nr:MAG: hypothetical protein ALECFALPRED_008662 [Alectoria fallacina]
MVTQSKSAYASAPVKFIVDGEPLYIHADLVSRQFKLLDGLINGPMGEAHEGVATMKDVDHGTFVRFIEWAHRGYYTAAEFTTAESESPRTSTSQDHMEVVAAPHEESSDIPAPAPEAELDLPQEDVLRGQSRKDKKKGKKATEVSWESNDWGMPNQRSRKDTAQELKGGLKEAFSSRKYVVRQGVFEIPSPRPNENPEEDYTDVFLSHAQLYVFADKYDMQSLKVLALEELHATLAIYTLYPVRTGDIIALLRYVYGNTGPSRGDKEGLRNVLTMYIGYEMDTLMNDEDFRDLMIEDGGDLLGDFMKMVAKRISSNV